MTETDSRPADPNGVLANYEQHTGRRFERHGPHAQHTLRLAAAGNVHAGNDMSAPSAPERDVRASELRPTRWIERHGVIQQIIEVESRPDAVWICTNRESWLRLQPRTWIGIWESDPRQEVPADPAAPF